MGLPHWSLVEKSGIRKARVWRWQEKKQGAKRNYETSSIDIICLVNIASRIIITERNIMSSSEDRMKEGKKATSKKEDFGQHVWAVGSCEPTFI